jgi:hypothetical protein
MVKRQSSPGLPMLLYGMTNAVILDDPRVLQILVELVLDRLRLLSQTPFDHDYSDRRASLEARLVDHIRIFVKQEPHKKAKVEAKRWRLIWSISLVDQLVERFMWTSHTKREILCWESIPSKPGMGSSDEQIRSLAEQIAKLRSVRTDGENGGLADRDVIASDMELAEWMLFCGMVSCLREYDYPVDSDFWRIHVARHKLGCRPVVVLSDGTMYETIKPGLMLSGRYVTSFLNSRIYVFATTLRGERAMCMGDDTIESNDSDMSEEEIIAFYLKVGLPTEVGLRALVEGIEFCSMEFYRRDGSMTAYPKRWMRTLFRLLSSAKPVDGVHYVSSEAMEQFRFETRNLPTEWHEAISSALISLVEPDKTLLEPEASSSEESSVSDC